MTEYKCGNCSEISRLGPNARFCPYCGSTSLNLVIKEESALVPFYRLEQMPGVTEPDYDIEAIKRGTVKLKEEKKPRRPKQASE